MAAIRAKEAEQIDPGFSRWIESARLGERPAETEQAARNAALSSAIDALEIRVKRIGYGSLELVLLVFGFTKLAELAGIDREDFAKYLEVFAPTALNGLFGTDVPLEADATTGGAISNGGTPRFSGASESWPLLFYLVPALFALLAAGGVLWALSGVATALVDERKMIAAGLLDERKTIAVNFHDEMKDTTDERKQIATQLSSLATKMVDAQQKQSDTLDKANKQLFDSQLDFIKLANAGANARDAAVVDFVKTRLGGNAPPAPIPVPPMPNSDQACIPSHSEMIQLQHALQARRLFAGGIDGVYGPITAMALARLQVEEKLPITGYPNKAAMERLGVPCTAPSTLGMSKAELIR